MFSKKIVLNSKISIKNPILKMKDYDFSIRDFVQRCLLQILILLVLRAFGNEPQIY